MSNFWSNWIIVLTVITLVGIVWLLLATRTMKLQVDEKAQKDNTTGHVYDGITEEDNPLPGWWLWMFVISIVFGVGYLVAFPGMGNFPGLLGWTSPKYHDAQEQQLTERFMSSTVDFAQQTVEELALDSKALKMGQRLFANNCAVCHGASGGGSEAFPNLSDEHWQWGGSASAIVASITHGRRAAMPAWGSVIDLEKSDAVVAYIQSLGGEEATHDAAHSGASDAELALGQSVYGQFCVACHGAAGEGNQLLGAPALNDDYWLYGDSTGAILNSVKNGRDGVMPAHKDLLSETKIKLIAAFVLDLSNPKQ